MDTLDKSHVDLEDGGGGGRLQQSASVIDGGSENCCSTASGMLPLYVEQRRLSGLSATDTAGVPEEGSESPAPECSAPVDVDLEAGFTEVKVHSGNSQTNCRICHLSSDATSQELGIPIELGCSCKDDLAAAHKHCAEAWFKIKGNKTCEICGSTAHNVCIDDEANDTAAAPATAPVPLAETHNFWLGLYDFLMVLIVFGIAISWMFYALHRPNSHPNSPPNRKQ